MIKTTALQSSRMPSSLKPAWYLVPVRILLVAFLLTLLAFAVSLLLGILGLVVTARLQGIHPNMTAAYRHIALPFAAAVGIIVLISASAMEVRRYHHAKALADIERVSR